MKKLVFGLIATVMFGFVGSAQIATKADVYKYLQLKYDFEKIVYNVNESKNNNFINALKNDKFISASVSLGELNLLNISVIYHKDGIKSLLIPYIKNSNNNLIVSINGNDYNTFLKTTIVKYEIDAKGNGFIYLSNLSETFNDKFVDGKKQISTARKSCFRICFDQAYDSVCDGFIGCVAWSVSPLPALAAATYCGLSCG